MEVEHKGTIIYLDASETILIKKLIQYAIIDNLISGLFRKEELEKLKWLDKQL